MPFADLGASSDDISEIIESFEEEAEDIPVNLLSEILTTQDFVMGVMHVELVDKSPNALGLGLDGFGSSQGNDDSDFGWEDSLIDVAGLSMQNLISDANNDTTIFSDLINYANLSGLQPDDVTIDNIYLYMEVVQFSQFDWYQILLNKMIV